MLDAHMHLDFIANAEEVAAEAGAAGVSLYACTVTPGGYASARDRFAAYANVEVGLGLHPWWVAGFDENATPDALNRFQACEGALQPDEALEAFLEHLTQAYLVGEVGLDFGNRHVATRASQIAAFERIARECGKTGGKVLTIHSVHAAREAIEILEDAGAFRTCACVFHWFTGPSDLLKRAVQAGAWFSVGLRMLNTGKGREYVKAIPADRLLLETDAPARRGQTCSFASLHDELLRVAEGIGRMPTVVPSPPRA